MSAKRLCKIYKSPREPQMYLYVDRERDLEPVPKALLGRFGAPEPVMDLILTPDRKLARADAAAVLERIDEQGFYLQMPPAKEALMDDAMAVVSAKNRKLKE